MCGILGQFSFKGISSKEKYARANNIVKYSGPDDFDYLFLDKSFAVHNYFDENLRNLNSDIDYLGAFGFRRLAFLDLSKYGHQSMFSLDKKYWIIYNGEVYNNIGIREE